jgi:hypothetical protein
VRTPSVDRALPSQLERQWAFAWKKSNALPMGRKADNATEDHCNQRVAPDELRLRLILVRWGHRDIFPPPFVNCMQQTAAFGAETVERRATVRRAGKSGTATEITEIVT